MSTMQTGYIFQSRLWVLQVIFLFVLQGWGGGGGGVWQKQWSNDVRIASGEREKEGEDPTPLW